MIKLKYFFHLHKSNPIVFVLSQLLKILCDQIFMANLGFLNVKFTNLPGVVQYSY